MPRETLFTKKHRCTTKPYCYFCENFNGIQAIVDVQIIRRES